MSRAASWTGVALILGLLAGPASAEARLDRIRAAGTIRCGAVERPGLMAIAPDGTPAGLLVDLCRAAGAAVAGPSARVVIDRLDSEAAFDAVRAGQDDLVFLTGSEIVDHALAGSVLPGPPAFFESSTLMVVGASAAQRPADLAGAPICFRQGTPSQRHLEAWFAAHHLPFIRMGYQEDVEMNDAFDAQRCRGLVGEATTLAAVRHEGGPTLRDGRLMAEALALYPVLAATPVDDAGWAAVVAWMLATVENADRPALAWSAGGLASLPLSTSAAAGSPKDWQATVVGLTGSYAALFDRHLGAASPLHLAPGPNALRDQGGLLTPAFAE